MHFIFLMVELLYCNPNNKKYYDKEQHVGVDSYIETNLYFKNISLVFCFTATRHYDYF